MRGQRTHEFEAEIAPPGSNPITVVLGSDVEPANEGDLSITDEQLAMVANAEAKDGKRVKDADFPADGTQTVPERIREARRAESVIQYPDLHSALPGTNESIEESFPYRTG